MKSNVFAFAVGGLLLVLTLTATHAAPAAAPRKSADGLDLPAAAPQRMFMPKIALVGAILGQRPEDVGRVFNAKKSAALLARHTKQDLGCDWFVLNIDGADIAGLTLTDGRVSKVALYYETVNQTRESHLRKQVEGAADGVIKVAIKAIKRENDKKQSLMIEFEVNPIDFYLATHTLDPKVADALRQHIWIAEMTDEQALLIGDGPGKYAAIFASDNKGDGTGAGTVFADGGGADVRIEFQARNKQDAREQALKRHKNLKEITKVVGPDAPGAGK